MPDITHLLAGYPVVIEQAVAWGDMDAYQHVNNVVYFRYFENARIEYLERLGWSEVEEQTGVGPIVSALQARFRKPLVFPDTIAIATKVGTLGADRFTLQHLIVSHKLAAIVTEGEGTVVTYNYAEQRKASLPELMRQRILELEAVAGNTVAE